MGMAISHQGFYIYQLLGWQQGVVSSLMARIIWSCPPIYDLVIVNLNFYKLEPRSYYIYLLAWTIKVVCPCTEMWLACKLIYWCWLVWWFVYFIIWLANDWLFKMQYALTRWSVIFCLSSCFENSNSQLHFQPAFSWVYLSQVSLLSVVTMAKVALVSRNIFCFTWLIMQVLGSFSSWQAGLRVNTSPHQQHPI